MGRGGSLPYVALQLASRDPLLSAGPRCTLRGECGQDLAGWLVPAALAVMFTLMSTGLSISRRLVEVVGGAITALSPAVRRRGTRFVVRLPVAQPTPIASRPAA